MYSCVIGTLLVSSIAIFSLFRISVWMFFFSWDFLQNIQFIWKKRGIYFSVNFVICFQIEWHCCTIYLCSMTIARRGHNTDFIFILNFYLKWICGKHIDQKKMIWCMYAMMMMMMMCYVCWFVSWIGIPINNVEIAWNWRIVNNIQCTLYELDTTIWHTHERKRTRTK